MDIKQKIEAANAEAARRITDADPVLVDVAPAGEVVPGLEDRMVLHSGPPISWDRMCGAQRGAVIGMVLFEGWAEDIDGAKRLLEAGEIRLDSNHHHNAVGPMAGTISRSLPVWVVENRAAGNRAFCRNVEADQQFGNYHAAALDGLRKWRDVWGPALGKSLRNMGGLQLKPIIAKALQMGDELHNRPNAASSLFANVMSANLVEADLPREHLLATLRYTAFNEFLFLGLSMASAKASADAAVGVEYSTVVTAMSRNGTDFGIRVSGLPGDWFTGPAPEVEGLFLPGYGRADAGLDVGDSAITECVGWGGFVIGGASGILSLVGGTAEQALAWSRAMREITVTTSPNYRMPILDFEGAPVGIDIRRVVQTGQVPVIDTAIAHREPGYSKIGGGIVRPPMECFKKALVAFARKYGLS